jgi:hypothetical protein
LMGKENPDWLADLHSACRYRCAVAVHLVYGH